MLNTLRLINFRRHVDTEIDFSDDAQIIAITGRNGAGKSTLLEALVYAFYGESRHGRRGLAKMVRRSAEYEGMQVELEFTESGTRYKVWRRYDSGKSTAKLFVNGNEAHQSPDAVTREITRVLGMDAVGFRLAVIAQQGDVEGLADLKAARRKETVSRLLRQDAVTTAAGRARDIHNREKDIWRAMGSGPDLEALTRERDGALAEGRDAQASVADATAALAELNQQLATTDGVEAKWHAAQVKLAAARATADAATAEVNRIRVEWEAIQVPAAVDLPDRQLPEILAELSDVNVAIAKAESDRQAADTAEQTRADLANAEKQLDAQKAAAGTDTPASIAMALAQQGGAAAQAEEAEAGARSRYDELRESYVTWEVKLAELEDRATRASHLGDVCDVCEQAITDKHRHRQEAERAALRATIQAGMKETKAAGEAVAAQLSQAQADAAAARSRREELIRRRTTVEAAVRAQKELVQRIDQYRARLGRLRVTEPVDQDALFATKGRLEADRVKAQQAVDVMAARTAALAQQERVAEAWKAAEERSASADIAHTAAEPDGALRTAYTSRVALSLQRDSEAELLAAVEQQAAVAAERVKSAERAIADASRQHERALQHRTASARAATAAAVLKVTAEKLADQIRPALEQEVSAVLAELSEGRFTRVKVTDDYGVFVEDDGSFEPLSEFSGGQRVMIALATRLALANVVAERHGGSGPGFLILDEVFGSQDSGRREAILSSLRAMRAVYGQILLISHVGGFDDAADRVLDVTEVEEDGCRVAQVTAL